MLSFLKDHPFPVQAHFDRSIVLTYAADKTAVQELIPECLEPDSFNDRHGFLAVAMVQTRSLRPSGFPAFLGQDFFLIGYRVFVRYKTAKGNYLRGLYILGSRTDRKLMAFFGNLFTHYRYSTIDVESTAADDIITVESRSADLRVVVNANEASPELPSTSPFVTWKEARRFAGPLPFTFTYEPASKRVLIIEGVRENWTPRPIEVLEQKVGFLADLNISPKLANAFIVEDIPYSWKKGRSEVWRG